MELLAPFDVFLDQADVLLNLLQNIEKHKERSTLKKKKRKHEKEFQLEQLCVGSPMDTRPIRLGLSLKRVRGSIVPFAIQNARCCLDPPISAAFSNGTFPLIK
jgi:hypothetical protein